MSNFPPMGQPAFPPLPPRLNFPPMGLPGSALPPLPPAPAPPPGAKTSGLAIASLVCGIGGFCTLGLSGIAGIALGIVALMKIRKSAGATAGGGMAIAGIVISAISLLAWLFLGAVLALVSLHAVAPARDEARAQMFMNNALQLHKAAILYAAENEGALPPPEEWPEAIEKHLGEREELLADPSRPADGRALAMNAALRNQTLMSIADRSRTVMFFECAPGSPPAGGRELLPPQPRYRGRYVIGFCDGHIERVAPGEVGRLVWDPKAGPAETGPAGEVPQRGERTERSSRL